MFKQESLKDVVVVEDLNSGKKPPLGSGDVEFGNQKLRANEKGKYFIDDLHASNIVGSRCDATITGSGGSETRLAGDNLASPIVAEDLIDVGKIPAILAICGVPPERRSNGTTTTYSHGLSIAMRTARAKSLTTLGVAFDINTIVTTAVGDTTGGLSNRASRIIALPPGGRITLPGGALRTTTTREVPTHTVTLAVRRIANTIGGICRRERRVTIPAPKVAGTLDAARGAGV